MDAKIALSERNNPVDQINHDMAVVDNKLVVAPHTAPDAHDGQNTLAAPNTTPADNVTNNVAPTTSNPPEYYANDADRNAQNEKTALPGQAPPANPTVYAAAPSLVTPIMQLSPVASMVDCPKCQMQTMTRTDREIGSRATVWGVILCLVCGPCVAWIPCVIPKCKDTLHYCSRCDLPLAIVKASGVVQPAQPAMNLAPSQYTAPVGSQPTKMQ